MMFYDAAKSLYISNCRASGKSHNTVESYERSLDLFSEWLRKKVSVYAIADITPGILLTWKSETAEMVSPSTLRLYVSHLRTFFEFCFEMEYIPKNPFKKKVMEVKVKDSDVKDTKTHVLSPICFKLIWSNDQPRDTHRKAIARNRAILMLLITSGIRCESLCNLRPADLDIENHRIRIENAKGGKNGEVVYSDVAFDAVQKYLLSGYHPESWGYGDTLFGFVDGNGIWNAYSRNQLSNIVEAAVRGFTGEIGFRPHSMRHTCASLLSANGLSDGEISVLLMHSDGTGAQVTNRYIDRDNTRLFDKANKVFSKLIYE